MSTFNFSGWLNSVSLPFMGEMISDLRYTPSEGQLGIYPEMSTLLPAYYRFLWNFLSVATLYSSRFTCAYMTSMLSRMSRCNSTSAFQMSRILASSSGWMLICNMESTESSSPSVLSTSIHIASYSILLLLSSSS